MNDRINDSPRHCLISILELFIRCDPEIPDPKSPSQIPEYNSEHDRMDGARNVGQAAKAD